MDEKKPEPTEFVFDPEDPICPVCHESLGLMDGCEWSDNPIENSCRECLFDYIDSLTAELKAKDKEIAKLRKAVLEALGDAKALWAGVGNHPASRYAKDVAYYEKVLKGEVTNG